MQAAIQIAKRIQLQPLPRPQRQMINHHLVIHNVDAVELLRPSDIVYVKADSNYCTFYLADGSTVMSSKTLGSYEKGLLARGFLRPHQSFIVNRNGVRRIKRKPCMTLVLRDDSEIPVARARRMSIFENLTANC